MILSFFLKNDKRLPGKISFGTSLGGASPLEHSLSEEQREELRRVIVGSSDYVLIQPD